MNRLGRLKLLGLTTLLVALLATVGGLVISQAAGGSGIKALMYDDAVRFTIQNDRVEILRAEVFDLGGKRLFDSGPTMGNTLDWAMTTEAGERVAYGVYLYVVTAWDSGGELLKSQVGKLALVPGGVGLGQAPAVTPPTQEPVTKEEERTVRALTQTINDNLQVNGRITTTESGSNVNILRVEAGPGGGSRAGFYFIGHNPSNDGDMASMTLRTDFEDLIFSVKDTSAGLWHELFRFFYLQDKLDLKDNDTVNINKLGIGTTSPSATLEVHGSATNLLALYDPVNGRVFRVEKDGDTYADGSYYCGAGAPGCYQSGSADVAERINTSEWVEQGNVVEIDPEHPGFFRKTRSSYSTSAAGIISTSPGVILGNNFDAKADRWEDNRPMLALAGRVPVKVTTENGPIQVGDLLISSSEPGYAMRCSEHATCVGATIGKALDSLEEGTGEIMVQVTLR